MLGPRGDLQRDRAVKRITERRLFAATGLYFPTRIIPDGQVQGMAGRRGNVVHSGVTPAEGFGVQLHEDAHVFWRDALRDETREPTFKGEYRSDATAGYWMVLASIPPVARGAYIALLHSFGANQGDHGTAAGRVRAFQAGFAAGERDVREGLVQGTGLDEVLQDLDLVPPRIVRPGKLRYQDAVLLATMLGR